MKKIALIACSNGYGHIKRLLLLSQSLIKNGSDPVLFAPAQAVHALTKSENVTAPKLVDFDTNTRIENWLDGTSVNWVNFIPSLDCFDIVISDNLIEVLLIRPDSWLLGSFFWHESLNFIPYSLKVQSIDILRKHTPRMISSIFFSSEELKLHTKFFEVGLFTDKTLSINTKGKNDALISCGLGGEINEQAKKFVEFISIRKKPKFNRVWVEPNILPYECPDWMIPATYTYKMYQNIIAAIIRPGVGTITSALLSGARIFPFYEDNNKEMELNASRIYYHKVGEKRQTLSNAWSKAELFLTDEKSQKKHFQKVRDISMNGSDESAKIILS